MKRYIIGVVAAGLLVTGCGGGGVGVDESPAPVINLTDTEKITAVNAQGVQINDRLVAQVCDRLGKYSVTPGLYDGEHQQQYHQSGLGQNMADADYIVDQAVLIGCAEKHGQHARHAPAWLEDRPTAPPSGLRPSERFEAALTAKYLGTAETVAGLSTAMSVCGKLDETVDPAAARDEAVEQMRSTLSSLNNMKLQEVSPGMDSWITDQQIHVFCPQHASVTGSPAAKP